jgi:hypothetical protein
MADFSYIGRGRVMVKVYGAPEPALFLGDVSALSLKVNEDVKTLEDFTQVGGGTYNEVRRIGSVELSATLHDYSAENLAMVLFGSVTTVTTTSTLEALTQAAKEYDVLFEGLNEARSGKAVTFHAYRWKMGPAQQLDLIGNDFAKLDITGKLLRDDAIVTAGLSKYFNIAIVT